MWKKVIAALLALVCTLGLAAACDKTPAVIIGETDAPTLPKMLMPSDVTSAIIELFGEDKAIDQLTGQQQVKLEKFLNSLGFNVKIYTGTSGAGITVQAPEGLSVAATSEYASTAKPTTFPAGTSVKSDEVYTYIQNTQKILQSKNFMLKGRAINPMGGSSTYVPMVMAAHDDDFAMETTIDWAAMIKEMSPDDPYGQAGIQAAAISTLMGNRVRMVFGKSKALWVFPDRRSYLNLMELAGENAEAMNNYAGLFDMIKAEDVPKDVKSSKVILDGVEYLCATLDASEGQGSVKYYFKDKKLARLEFVGLSDGESNTSIIEVEELSTPADDSYFSVSGMTKTPLAEMEGFFGAISGGTASATTTTTKKAS
jgi:hypothetical protein